MHKWALINRALEMNQPEPVETYSSSPHLYTDLDIPEGSKGRLKSTPIPKVEREASHPPRERSRSGSSSGRGDSRGSGSRGTASGGSSTAGPAATSEPRAEGSGTPRRRRRRRTGGSGAGGASAGSAPTGE
jgi:hypothetical protein